MSLVALRTQAQFNSKKTNDFTQVCDKSSHHLENVFGESGDSAPEAELYNANA